MKKVYYIKGRYLNDRRVDDIDRAEGKRELHHLLHEYRLAYGRDWTLWVTDSHGKKLDEEDL